MALEVIYRSAGANINGNTLSSCFAFTGHSIEKYKFTKIKSDLFTELVCVKMALENAPKCYVLEIVTAAQCMSTEIETKDIDELTGKNCKYCNYSLFFFKN